jgi:hypothetical protein
MNTALICRLALRLALGAALCAAALSSPAQNSRSVRLVPQRQAPVLAPGAVGPGAPQPAGLPSPIANPAGLPSPIPNPGGLTSQFPAGLPPPPSTTSAGEPLPAGTPVPPAATTGGRGRGTAIDIVPQTTAMGAGGYGVPPGPQYLSTGPAPYTALQIAQSFLGADANRDGELTRAEARRLSIMPSSFEEMDRDHDGILTRSEYEDAVR